MPWAVVYFIVLVLALAAGAEVQLGWRPPFILLWDGFARIWVSLVAFFLALGSAIGLVGAIPVDRWPKRLRLMPLWMALSLVMFGYQGLTSLSAYSTLGENLKALQTPLGIGLGIGLFTGLVSVFTVKEPEERQLPPANRHLFFVAILVGIFVIGCGVLFTPRGRDDGKIVYSEQFNSPTSALIVQAKAAPLDHEIAFGLVEVKQGHESNAVVLEAAEWDRFVTLLSKAEASPAANWTDVGSIQDTGTGDTTTLTLGGGQGVRFVERSPHGATVEFDLPASEIGRLNGAIAEVRKNLQRE